jgi:hypothetical protein
MTRSRTPAPSSPHDRTARSRPSPSSPTATGTPARRCCGRGGDLPLSPASVQRRRRAGPRPPAAVLGATSPASGPADDDRLVDLACLVSSVDRRYSGYESSARFGGRRSVGAVLATSGYRPFHGRSARPRGGADGAAPSEEDLAPDPAATGAAGVGSTSGRSTSGAKLRRSRSWCETEAPSSSVSVRVRLASAS